MLESKKCISHFKDKADDLQGENLQLKITLQHVFEGIHTNLIRKS